MTTDVGEIEEGLRMGSQDGTTPVAMRTGAGIFVEDPVHRRLVESALVQLELEPVVLSPLDLDPAQLVKFELIVADDSVASQIRSALATHEERGEGINPAVIAVRMAATEGASTAASGFDGVLMLPELPSAVAAQMSLVLYSHRAFAKRYKSALDELHLNRRIFRSVTSGICVANATLGDMPLVYVNPAFEVMTGYSLEECLGRNCRFLQRENRDQTAVRQLREAIDQQKEVTVVLRNFRKDGTPFWNELSLSPIRNREGVVTHFVGIQTDVTARVEFEAALRESEKLAAVGRLASSIAHEINNPLESVTNLLYLAQTTEDQTEARSFLAQADKELQRVALITSQSLRFYKQSSRPQKIGCHDLLNSVLHLYEGRAQNADISMHRRERSDAAVLCMESEIRQVLNNLIRNAVDAMAGRGGRLLLRSREATDWNTGAPGVLMTIADTGSGISAQTLENLYRPFFTTKGIAGTGLGLWISSEIVARHQGHLRVRSRQNADKGGTVFQLFLPLESSPVEPASSPGKG